jgi:hypothetical protein
MPLADTIKHIGQPDLRIDTIKFGGFDQRVDGRRALAAAVGTGEQPDEMTITGWRKR